MLEGSDGDYLRELPLDVADHFRPTLTQRPAPSQGLRHIHNLGILHLDLKPSNILITKSGSLQISDFGLSTRQGDTTSERACSRQQLGPSSSDASLREGDREYLSPEILRGEFGRAADAFR